MNELEKNVERTFVMIKPDGMIIPDAQQEITETYRKNGLDLVFSKLIMPSTAQLDEHYAEHKGKPWLPSTIDYIIGQGEDLERYVKEVLLPKYGKINTHQGNIVMMLEGKGAISIVRSLNGPTDPEVARIENPESIRGKYGGKHGQGLFNVVHASANTEDARRELKLYFPEIIKKGI